MNSAPYLGYDEVNSLVDPWTPEITRALNITEDEALWLLGYPYHTLVEMKRLPLHIAPEVIAQELVTQFARDLIKGTPEAKAMREAVDQETASHQRLENISDRELDTAVRNEGITNTRLALRFIASALKNAKAREKSDETKKAEATEIKDLLAKVDLSIRATEDYQLAHAEFVLARKQAHQALEVWATPYVALVHLPVGQLSLELETDTELLARLPNHNFDRDLQRSLMLHPKNWRSNDDLGYYYHQGKEGHTVVYQPSEVELALGDAPARALDLLDQRFNKLKNETVADVIDILFHHWNTHKDSGTGAVPINAARLCEYRGKTLSGENLELHWHALRDAFSLTLRGTKSDINAKVFDFASQGENQDGPGARYVYRPGIFLEYALRGEELYFTPFLQKVWALDPVRNNEAKRLARYLRGDWRMNTEKYLVAESGAARAARWHSWEFLLAESGIDIETHRQGKNPKRLIETMARAVETLYQMEIIAEGGFDIYHPDDRKLAENLPLRGALDAWLTLRVCLAPSAKLREALIETDTKRRAGRERDAKTMSTERAKKRLRAQDGTKPRKRKS